MTVRTARKTRTPISGVRTRLNVRGKEDGYEYYIVNDTDDRVQRFQEGGWEVVSDKDVSIGERRVSVPTAEGSAKTVSVGGGVTGVLMKIKREYWEEDQARKHGVAQETVNETLRDAEKASDYGTVKYNRD